MVGHGVTASGVMGQLRAVLQDRLDAGGDIAEALAAADRFARRLPAAHATTVCLAMLDPADGTLSLLHRRSPAAPGDHRRGPDPLPARHRGTPLGTGGTFPVCGDRLDAGDMLLLYTDGILERPGRPSPGSARELAQVAADSAAGRALRDPDATPAERVCTQTVELLVRATGHTDDITLLAAQRVAPPPDLDLTLPAVPGSLRVSRVADRRLAGRARRHRGRHVPAPARAGRAADQRDRARLRPRAERGSRVVDLHARLGPDGCLEARVTDHGRWREPARQSVRGRGLALTAQLVDDVRVEPTGDGTVATLHHSLTRPSRMLTREAPAARARRRRTAASGSPTAPAATRAWCWSRARWTRAPPSSSGRTCCTGAGAAPCR